MDKKLIVNEDGSILRLNGKKARKYLDRDGYEFVYSGRKKFFVHRLVAKTYIPNPHGYPQVNHINGVKNDNRISNLEWCTNSHNQTHSRYVLGNNTGFSDTPVRCIETGEAFVSTRDAWRKTGVSYSHISESARGKRKTAGGYHWEGINDPSR